MSPLQLQLVLEDCYGVSPSGDALGFGFYPPDRLTEAELERLVVAHLHAATEDLATCSLFGGVVVIASGNPVLWPQCCATVADVKFWLTVRTLPSDLGWLMEGHPCPGLRVRGGFVELVCTDDVETFFPPSTPELQRFPLRRLLAALTELEVQAADLEHRLQALPAIAGRKELVQLLTFEPS